jgi:DUF971 family protein
MTGTQQQYPPAEGIATQMDQTQRFPTELRLSDRGARLRVTFEEGEQFTMSAQYLRVHSPSAEVRGHGPGQAVLQTGKENVVIAEIEPVGNYAVRLRFSDGHDTGLYSWKLLYDLGSNHDTYWARYQQRLAEAGEKDGNTDGD